MTKKNQTETIRLRAQQMVDSGEITIRGLATVAGKSPATISLWLAAKYTGDNSTITSAIEDWLSRTADRVQTSEEIIQTTAFQNISQLLRVAHVEGGIFVAYGEAGVGKTQTIRHYAQTVPGVMLIEVDPSFTSLSFLQTLHRIAGFTGTGSLFDVMAELASKLRGSERLLIVDQAEYLPKRALDLVRSLYDRTGIGVVLLGMPKLMSNLKGKNMDFRQLYSRVDLAIKVEECSDEDVQHFVHRVFPESNGMWRAFAAQSRNARTLTKLLKQAKRMCNLNSVELSPELIQDVSKYILI